MLKNCAIRLLLIGMVVLLASCANTEVAKYAAAPGKEILIGQGGAFETTSQGGRNIDLWVEGSPNRPFKILARAKSTYSYGTADREMARNAAKSQIVEAAIANGGDAVVFGNESVQSIGTVYLPGAQTTNISPTYGGGFRATSYSNPGFAGTIGEGILYGYIVKYVEAP